MNEAALFDKTDWIIRERFGYESLTLYTRLRRVMQVNHDRCSHANESDQEDWCSNLIKAQAR